MLPGGVNTVPSPNGSVSVAGVVGYPLPGIAKPKVLWVLGKVGEQVPKSLTGRVPGALRHRRAGRAEVPCRPPGSILFGAFSCEPPLQTSAHTHGSYGRSLKVRSTDRASRFQPVDPGFQRRSGDSLLVVRPSQPQGVGDLAGAATTGVGDGVDGSGVFGCAGVE